MTNTPDELEPAVKRFGAGLYAAYGPLPVDRAPRLILSERAELLATVERMRGALEPLKNIADAYDDNSLDDEARKYWGRNKEHYNERPADQIELYTGRGGSRLLTLADCFAARAALTIGEGAMSNIVPTVEDLFRLQVAHGMEKSMSLKDPGGWPDYGEVTKHIDRMDNSEFLFAISMAIENRLAPDAGERG